MRRKWKPWSEVVVEANGWCLVGDSGATLGTDHSCCVWATRLGARTSLHTVLSVTVHGRLVHRTVRHFIPAPPRDPALFCPVGLLLFLQALPGTAQPLRQCPVLPRLWQMTMLGSCAGSANMAVPCPAKRQPLPFLRDKQVVQVQMAYGSLDFR